MLIPLTNANMPSMFAFVNGINVRNDSVTGKYPVSASPPRHAESPAYWRPTQSLEERSAISATSGKAQFMITSSFCVILQHPEETLQILHPLEIADGHAARVRKDIGDDNDALVEDLVGFRRRWAIRSLGNYPRLHAISIGRR